MRQFSRLFYFEWKKIWKRKSTWATFIILIACHIAIESLYLTGATYVEGEFLETHLEGAKKDAENGRRLSGRKIDGSLLQDMQAANLKFADEKDPKYVLSKDYQETVRPYRMVYQAMNRMLWGTGTDLMSVTEKQFYAARKAAIIKQWDDNGLSDAEKAYWQKKEDRITKPFTYQYAEGYDYLISMSGIYRVCMFVTFLIAICMSIVFTEEHSRKTDQLILCSKLGRKQAYAAKILAGSLFAPFVTIVVFLVSLGFAFGTYGADGFSAAIQLHVGAYTEPFTVGQVFLVMVAILLLSSMLTGIVTMVVSEITGSNLAAMSLVIAVMLIARIVSIPGQYRVFSQAWNYIPINLLKFDQGICDVRLVRMFGIYFTSWQFSIVLYIAFIIAFLLVGRKVYLGYQVKGR